MGIEAARVLLARMNGQEVSADVLLRPELVVRRSTAAPRKPSD
jgi:DNA-binding LacI/PurR family transcriptional regulator